MENDKVQLGDCLGHLRNVPPASVNLVYLDPPFFTGKVHRSGTRDGATTYSFDDVWADSDSYVSFLSERLDGCKSAMREDASIFFHADHNNVHLGRRALDLTFGPNNFQSEIIWSYKRWSNSKKGLLQQHQTILFYSKSKQFKWNPITVGYSATTNVDQILQRRARDDRGKSVYASDDNGDLIYGGAKKGVPLGDVWEIPFLNPKAKERTGYPTQKPLLLLERIIELTTDVEDLVIDPFCGSGTTLVAAKLLGRKYLGFDVLSDAVSLAEQRLLSPVKTTSKLLEVGLQSYVNSDPWIEAHLTGLDYSRIQRNSGADAVLKQSEGGKPIFVRVQKKDEGLAEAVFAVKKAIATKGNTAGIVIATGDDLFEVRDEAIRIIPSPSLQIKRALKSSEKDDRLTDSGLSKTA